MIKKKYIDLLNQEVENRNDSEQLSSEKPDPIIIAHRHRDEYISLACALFAYGKASLIVKFLDSIDFSILEKSEEIIREHLKAHYYRFQKSEDVVQFFISLKRLRAKGSLEDIFYEGYKKESSVMDGVSSIIRAIQNVNSYSSQGYKSRFVKMNN